MSREDKNGGEVSRGDAQAPQSPWGSATVMPEMTVREIDEAVRECISGNCEKAKTIIRMSAYMGASPLMQIIGSYVANTLRGYLSARRIRRMVAIGLNALWRLFKLGDFFEFGRIGDFSARTIFDVYWMYTSLITLKLPFVVRSRFDPPNDVCSAFKDEELCHKFIAGFVLAESWKSDRPSCRFKLVGTTHPVTVTTMLSIASHLAKHGIMTKAYINEGKRYVSFIYNDLPEDVERFVEDAWRDPTTLTKLTDGEFLAFLAGLVTGDGSIKWSNGVIEVILTGNLEKEKTLYMTIQSELLRRFGIKAFLYEKKNRNIVELRTWSYDAVRLLRMLPPLIEPLKELRRQLVLRRGVIGVFTAKKIFELLGDEKENGEKGIHKLQSHQAVRFLTILTRLGLIRLKEVQGRKYRILETPTNPRGRSPS